MSSFSGKKYIVFHIEGGIGKNIMATAVVILATNGALLELMILS